MALTAVDKIKINKYLKEHAIDDIYFTEVCDTLAKKEKLTYTEFLDYFTDYVINEFNKNEKISIKHISKIIYLMECILIWIKKYEEKVKDETIYKVSSLKEFYNEYLKRNELEIDQEFYDKYLKAVVKISNKMLSSETKKEPVTQYINKIKTLETELQTLKHQLEKLTEEYDKISVSHNKKMKKIETLNNEISLFEKEIETKDEEILKLHNQLEELNQKLINIELLLSHTTSEKEELIEYKNLYESLINDYNKLKQIIEEKEKQQKLMQSKKETETKIESIIYQKLLFEGLTIDDLIKILIKEGYYLTKEEVSGILKNIKTKININSNRFSLSPIYQITKPEVIKDDKFIIDIPDNCQYIDIMLVSDFHIRNIDSKIISGFEMINDYCINNNIQLILNLGDFYNGIGNKTLEYSKAMRNYQLIEDTIKKIPRNDLVYHAILGGNHDRNILSYGYDPIQILTSEREDFIHLGYNHSTICLNNNNKQIGLFDIHHPEYFDFEIDLTEAGMDTQGIEKYLNKIYERSQRSRDYSYIDILGHTHKSQFNFYNSYYYLPSFFEGHNKRGACHLRIYFEENKEIKYMVFMPLNIGAQLVKNNEIVYKKILTK